MSKALELVGQKFGHLTVIKRVENNKKNNSKWLCKCSCGKESIVLGWGISKGKSKSCGCRHGLTPQEYIKMKSKIDKNYCWIWENAKDKNGYGKVRYDNKDQRAHRFSYQSFKGKIPDKKLVLYKGSFLLIY